MLSKIFKEIKINIKNDVLRPFYHIIIMVFYKSLKKSFENHLKTIQIIFIFIFIFFLSL